MPPCMGRAVRSAFLLLLLVCLAVQPGAWLWVADSCLRAGAREAACCAEAPVPLSCGDGRRDGISPGGNCPSPCCRPQLPFRAANPDDGSRRAAAAPEASAVARLAITPPSAVASCPARPLEPPRTFAPLGVLSASHLRGPPIGSAPAMAT
jgi:hypothetical protein